MKQFTLLSLLIFFLTGTVYSQKNIQLSFSGSPSVNWMSTTNPDAENGKPMLGYDFGLNGDFYFSNNQRYSLLTGLQISNIGGETSFKRSSDFLFSGNILPGISKIKYRLRYVEVPLAIKLKTDQFHRTKYWGQFGLATMINIDSKADSNDGTLKKASINDEVQLFNLAMIIGAGFDFDLGGSNAVTAGLVFQNGLMDVTTNNAFSDKTIINSLKLKIGLIF